MAPPPAPGERDAPSATPAWRKGTPLFRDDTPAPSERGETPQPSGMGMDLDEDEDMQMADDGLSGLLQLTQSFRGAKENDEMLEGGARAGVRGGEDVDFDADVEGVMGGDADD